MASGPHRLPVLSSRSLVRWLLATVVGLLVVAGWVAVTDPANAPWAAGLVAVLTLVAVGYRTSATSVDAAAGTVERRVLGLRRTADVAAAPRVGLADTGTGILTLDVGRARGLPVHLPLLRIDDYVEASLDATSLGVLVDLLERHRPAERQVAEALRAQASYVAAGGDARTSPLAEGVSRGILDVAKGGGAAGSGGLVGRLFGG